MTLSNYRYHKWIFLLMDAYVINKTSILLYVSDNFETVLVDPFQVGCGGLFYSMPAIRFLLLSNSHNYRISETRVCY